MKKLRLLSLCSGIGGADLAAEWTGAIEIVGQVEINTFCQQVLALHWPHVKRAGDIREVQGGG
jgi:DNA (cytosine-5)-methyltransferase 1